AALVGQNETPLGFAFGYHWQKEDGLLMLATREALPALPAEPQAQKVRVRKWPALGMAHHDEFKRRNKVKTLSLRTNAGNQIVRGIAAETGIMPILVLPFRNQHLLEIELATVRSSAIIPPAERKGTIGRASAPALLKRISRDDRRAIRQNKVTEFCPLSGSQNPTCSQ